MAEPSDEPFILLLGPGTSQGDFERFAQEHGWSRQEQRPASGQERPSEQTWLSADGSTAISYVDDPVPQGRHLILQGPDDEALVEDMRAGDIDIQTIAEVAERTLLASTNAERIASAWQLAVVTKLYDETVLDFMKSLYYHDANEDVRGAVVDAIGYRGWPEARAFLDEVGREDSSPELREKAASIAARLDDVDTGTPRASAAEEAGEGRAEPVKQSRRQRLTRPPPADGPVVFLLRPETSHADFERLAHASNWILDQDRRSTDPRRPHEQIWLTQDRTTAIHYLDDPTPKERFVVVYGRHTGAVAFDLGAGLRVEVAEDVVDRALKASTNAERVAAAWQLAVVTKLHDEAVLDLLKKFYDDSDESVRHAVVNGVGYRGWPEARGFLENVARQDPSPALRENARAIVDAWWGDESGAGDQSDKDSG